MSNESEAFLERMKNAGLYRDLKERLYKLALAEFNKSKVRFQSEFKLGINRPIPIGYVGVRELVEIDVKDWDLESEVNGSFGLIVTGINRTTLMTNGTCITMPNRIFRIEIH